MVVSNVDLIGLVAKVKNDSCMCHRLVYEYASRITVGRIEVAKSDNTRIGIKT
jgi:hypothetical protein